MTRIKTTIVLTLSIVVATNRFTIISTRPMLNLASDAGCKVVILVGLRPRPFGSSYLNELVME